MPRQPHVSDSWLAAPLSALTRGVLGAPRTVVVCGLVVAVLSLLLTAKWLGFRTSRLDLLSRESSYNQRWLAYLDEFGEQDDVVVVVEGHHPARVTAAMEDLAARISEHRALFATVLHRRDLTKLRPKALHYLSVDELRGVEQFLRQFQPVLDGDWSQLGAVRLLQQATRRLAARDLDLAKSSPVGKLPSVDDEFDVSPAGFSVAASAGQLPASWPMARLMTSLNRALSDPPGYLSPWPASLQQLEQLDRRFDSTSLLVDGGRMGFVLLRFASREQRFIGNAESLARLRELIAEVQTRHARVTIGLTGMPVLENDEMRASQRDTIWTSVVSLFGVACVFIAGFGGVRRPLMTVATLLLALAWSLGFIVFSVGHLNILSASFGVILIGLGIDFGIHYVAQYSQLLETMPDRRGALLETARRVGPGIVTGGVTTALAFSTTALTHFTGIVELGVIAAGGIVLCIIAAVTVLPALISLWDRPLPAGWQQSLSVASLCLPLSKRPWLVLPAALLITLAFATGLWQLRYDHNLLNLQPLELESVALERKLASLNNGGVWFAVSLCDSREELARKQAEFESLATVTRTEEIVSIVPAADAEKERIIGRLRRSSEGLPDAPPLIPVAGRQELLAELRRCAVMLPQGSDERVVPAILLADDSPSRYFERLSSFQQRMAGELLAILRSIHRADPGPPAWSDLPAALADRFVGKNGKFLLRVYGHADIWNMDELQRFVSGIESVDPQVTGHPVQTYYASRQMLRSYIHAAVYSLLAVSIVLMIDFRRIHCWLLAMVPMALGMLQMFGLLGWLGIPLNPANMIALPLILGIGIDDGVHVVHDFLNRNERYRISNSTATAVVLTSATTMIGFGSMMFASHQGLRSLGQVLTIGIFCCLVSSLLVLPPLLRWFDGGFSAQREGDKLTGSVNEDSTA